MKKTDWIDVIGKIDPAYVKEAEQWSKVAQKKKNLRHFTAMAACVCILLAGAVVSFDLWVQNKDTGAETESAVAEGMNESASAPNERNETAVATAEEEQTEEVESDSAKDSVDANEQITINEVSELNTVAIDVGYGQEERMSAEELEQYYGVTVFPKNLPESLVAYAEEHDTDTAYAENTMQSLSGQKEEDQTSAERSIYYNKDHQVVDDNNTFLYESEDGNRSLEIGVRTMESGIITEFEDDDLKTSVINNREVTIARLAAEDECYLAIFTKEGVTFTIQTKNLTEEELLMVLRELC